MEISRDLRNPPASMQSSRDLAPRVDNNRRDMTGVVAVEEDLVMESSSKS